MAKQINARIKHKHDKESNWVKAINFIPEDGEIIIYEADEKNEVPRVKVGDGKNKVSNLKFITAPFVKQIPGKNLSTNDFTNGYKGAVEQILSLGDNLKLTYSVADGLELRDDTVFYNTGLLSANYDDSTKKLTFGLADNAIQEFNFQEIVESAFQAIQNSSTPAIAIQTGTQNGSIAVNGTDVAVKGLGDLAYKNESDLNLQVPEGQERKEITIGTAIEEGAKILINPSTSALQYFYQNALHPIGDTSVTSNSVRPWEFVISRPSASESLTLNTGIFAEAQVLSGTNTDLNSIRSKGIYVSSTTENIANLPPNLANISFKILVLDGPSTFHQLLLAEDSTLYYRTYTTQWTDWIQLGGGNSVAVENTLTSTSTTTALSANQGRILNESKASVQAIEATLAASQWTANENDGFAQTQSIAAISGQKHLIVAPTSESFLTYGSCLIRASAHEKGSVTFIAETKPDVDIVVNLMEIT